MDYWFRFIQKWPDVRALASASEDDVLKMWQGLGYYSRARNLHAAARQIAAMPCFPHTFEEIRQLKGVGDYTAAAVSSFAFGLPKAAVDGNAYRVLSRVFGLSTPINSGEGKKEFAALAQSLLPSHRSADFNQAMMDFGSLQCTPKSPVCTHCVMQEICVAWRENRVGELPVKQKKMKVLHRHLVYYYLRCNGFTAIHQRAKGDIWQGLWEPYLEDDVIMQESGDARMKEGNVKSMEEAHLKKTGTITLLAGNVKHVLTHRVLDADFYLWQPPARPKLPEGYIWIAETDISEYAIPRLIQRLLEFLPPADQE